MSSEKKKTGESVICIFGCTLGFRIVTKSFGNSRERRCLTFIRNGAKVNKKQCERSESSHPLVGSVSKSRTKLQVSHFRFSFPIKLVKKIEFHFREVSFMINLELLLPSNMNDIEVFFGVLLMCFSTTKLSMSKLLFSSWVSLLRVCRRVSGVSLIDCLQFQSVFRCITQYFMCRIT